MKVRKSNFLLKAVQAFLTIFLFSNLAIAQQRTQGYVEQGGFQFSASSSARVQRSFPNANVTVYIAGTATLATIYSDSGFSVPKTNPFTADSKGYWSFYVANGRYDITFSGTGITTPFTYSDILVSGLTNQFYDPTNFGAKCDGATIDNTSFNALLTAIGNARATIQLPKTLPCKLNSITFPANVTIDYGASGGLLVTNANTITILGPQEPIAVGSQRYYNAITSLGQGSISIVGNKFASGMYPEWFGGKGDKLTENGYIIQTILDITTANGNPTLWLGAGVYNDGIAFQDVSLSNAQIVLPKVNNNQSMLTVKIKGVAAPSHPWNADSGSIIRSTLTTGNGNILGVKTNQGSSCTTATCTASNISSNIIVDFQDVTFRATVNPSYSGIDISRIRNAYLNNVRVDTDDFGAGGLNPHFFPGTNIPDPICTEPLTSTSYGIKLPTDYLTNRVVTNDIFVAGFYNEMRIGELGKGKTIVFHCGKVGFAVEGATWPNYFQNVVMAAVHTPIKALGATPELAGFSDTNLTNRIVIEDLGVENDTTLTWTGVNYIADDANGYLIGWARVFYGAGVALPLNLSTTNNKFLTYRTERPWSGVDPNGATGYTFIADENAVDETYRGKQVSTDIALGWKAVGCNQLGTNNGCGLFGALNHAIAFGLDNRLGFLYFTTDGAINNGKISVFVMNNGVSTLVGTIDRFGNWNYIGMLQSGESTLTITANTISPTTMVVHIGAGTINTINTPPGITADVCFDAIPDAAYLYTNTGNIVGPAGGGTATIGRLMRFCRSAGTSKWYPSY